MDDKAHLFFSSLPVLTDYVTIIAEVTTSGPHLLHSACCRALLRRIPNILASPVVDNNKNVYIVAHKDDIIAKSFREIVPQCNLLMKNVTYLTNRILQSCLDFTIHTFIHPQWTRIKNRYYQGRSCLFKNVWMGCVRSQITVQDKSVVMGVRGSVAKLTVARLSTFHIRSDIVQAFMKKETRTISHREMGDNTCYVLPSFKLALVHSISYDIADTCPLKDSSDMVAYWIDYHGMLIPSDTEIFVTLSFNFPGAPVMTYPYYCIRKTFPVTKPNTHLKSIDDYVADVNEILKKKVPKLQLQFPIAPAFAALPRDTENVSNVESGTCLTSVAPAGQINVAPYNVPKSPPHSKNILLPLGDVKSPEKCNVKSSAAALDPKLKPRFNPYSKPQLNQQVQRTKSNVCQDSLNSSRIVPVFQAKVSQVREQPTDSKHLSTKPIFNISNPKPLNNVSAQSQNKNVNKPLDNKRSKPDFSVSINTQESSNLTIHQTTTITHHATNSISHVTTSQSDFPSQQLLEPDLDDFEKPSSGKMLSIQKTPNFCSSIPEKQSPFYLTPTTSQNKGTSNPSSQIKMPSTPSAQSQTKKKTRAAPKIMSPDEIFAMSRRGLLAKVNTHSLAMFLKSKKFKGVNKMKKEQLVFETEKLLAPAAQREW